MILSAADAQSVFTLKLSIYHYVFQFSNSFFPDLYFHSYHIRHTRCPLFAFYSEGSICYFRFMLRVFTYLDSLAYITQPLRVYHLDHVIVRVVTLQLLFWSLHPRPPTLLAASQPSA